jgi:hypothetical protein
MLDLSSGIVYLFFFSCCFLESESSGSMNCSSLFPVLFEGNYNEHTSHTDRIRWVSDRNLETLDMEHCAESPDFYASGKVFLM